MGFKFHVFVLEGTRVIGVGNDRLFVLISTKIPIDATAAPTTFASRRRP